MTHSNVAHNAKSRWWQRNEKMVVVVDNGRNEEELKRTKKPHVLGKIYVFLKLNAFKMRISFCELRCECNFQFELISYANTPRSVSVEIVR